ncbi:MAG: hypothetical protein AAF153_01010 [Pseudomonadota bacterium]
MNISGIIKLSAIIFVLYVFATGLGPVLLTAVDENIDVDKVKQAVTTPAFDKEQLDLKPNKQLERVIGSEKMAQVAKTTKKLGYAERKLLGMFNAWSKTPEGQVWLDKMIKSAPAQQPEDLEFHYRDHVLDVIEINAGDIDTKGAECGQMAELTDVENGTKFTQLLGEAKDNLALEYGIFGLKPNGERKIVAKNGKNYHVRLNKLTPQDLPDNQLYHKKLGMRNAVKCGERVNLAIKIYSVDDGRLLYKHADGTSKAVLLNHTLPLAVLRGAVGMSNRGSTAVLMTPRMQRTINNKHVNFFPEHWLINNEKTYMLELKHVFN